LVLPALKRRPPKVKTVEWAKTDIDRFVLARLDKEDLTPVERRTAAL